ncbi:uncharacterized protein AB675_9002 [Cyphellophora attinorum]|uniref:Uncharacterized protein n=1 Tax=Cyphellophora attinorum TaxID=1664694 RepID=A0A0N1H658_9EURO|nr:uncharacterized protein AB675_9002 [Phialophora attinorum]KPI41442.1 hypothetical protein AB675_9002 [Phialophora attinorum]
MAGERHPHGAKPEVVSEREHRKHSIKEHLPEFLQLHDPAKPAPAEATPAKEPEAVEGQARRRSSVQAIVHAPEDAVHKFEESKPVQAWEKAFDKVYNGAVRTGMMI